jgi:hypothetical protein
MHRIGDLVFIDAVSVCIGIVINTVVIPGVGTGGVSLTIVGIGIRIDSTPAVAVSADINLRGRVSFEASGTAVCAD